MPAREPISRPAARVLLLDEHDRLLLFRIESEQLRTKSIWITPGGGLEPGESYEDAAKRELWEEAGVTDVPLGPCVWTRRHVFDWDGGKIEARESFFIARTQTFKVTHENVDEYERAMFKAHRWWAVDEIAASSEYFAPRELASLLQALLRDALPAAPIAIGI
jgi:8-oxo-dGTP pyrophosphatase MutT (NUDIX family)